MWADDGDDRLTRSLKTNMAGNFEFVFDENSLLGSCISGYFLHIQITEVKLSQPESEKVSC